MGKITLQTKLLFTVVVLLLLTVVSCEKDLEDVGANIIDNNNFNSNFIVSELITYNQAVPDVLTKGINQYLLGVTSSSEFGTLKASVAAQLEIPENNYDYGSNPVVDSVILEIPYQYTTIDNYSDGKPQFEIDSVFGNRANSFKLQIYELSTYLNELSFDNPTEEAEYLSSDTFDFVSLLQESVVNLDSNDTVLYIKRPLLPFVDGSVAIDTIKNNNSFPSLKVTLDKEWFSNKLMSQVGNNLSNQNIFSNYFKGLYLNSLPNVTEDSFIMSLVMTNAKVHVFYSHEEEFTGTDGITFIEYTGEQAIFPFSNTLTINSLDRDFTGAENETAITSPDNINGEEFLYPLGAAGTDILLELFHEEDIATLRANNWLINEANIYLYLKDQNTSILPPERLFLYNDTYNSQLIDVFSEGTLSLGGVLEYDDDNLPYRYKFTITDYMSQLLAQDSGLGLNRLRIKTYNTTDDDFQVLEDTILTNYNWNSKGVVLHGNLPITEEKRAKLEIFYSELTN